MVAVHLLKLLNWLMLGDCFGFFPSATKYYFYIIHQSGPDPPQDPHVHEVIPFWRPYSRLKGGYFSCAPDPSPLAFTQMYQALPPPQIKTPTSSSGYFLPGHRLLILQVRYGGWIPPRWKWRFNLPEQSTQWWEGKVSLSLLLNKTDACGWLFYKNPSRPRVLGWTHSVWAPQGSTGWGIPDFGASVVRSCEIDGKYSLLPRCNVQGHHPRYLWEHY